MIFFASKKPVKKKKVDPLYEAAKREMFAALAQRDQMLDNFNNCLPEFFDLANQELTLAQAHLSVCIKRVKMLEAS